MVFAPVPAKISNITRLVARIVCTATVSNWNGLRPLCAHRLKAVILFFGDTFIIGIAENIYMKKPSLLICC